MPELPEVETVVRDFKAHGIENSFIQAVEIFWPRTITGHSPLRFANALRGRRIVQVSRRGKYIILTLDNGRHVQIHLRMTGKFRVAKPLEKPGKHDHVAITLGDGRHLLFNDTRKFGRFHLTTTATEGLNKLGPEPLEKAFTSQVLIARLAGKTRMIKPLLLDQTVVAGLGNIYVDESLWQARIHPERRAESLTRGEIRQLHGAIQSILRRAIENCGTTLGTGDTNFYSVAGRRGRHADALKVFRRTNQPCPRCHGIIIRTVVGQRGTHVCPECQSLPGAVKKLSGKP